MMTILARALAWLTGAPKLLGTGALVGLLTLGHQWWLERDARLKAEAAATAKQTCEAEQQLATMKAERDAAKKVAERAVQAIEYEKQITEELRNERQAIRSEFDAYKVAASSDPRCLSDSVLDLLRGDGTHGAPRSQLGGGER